MASSYDISLGSGRTKLFEDSFNKIVGCQVISDSSLDAMVELKLQQSSDGQEFHDLPETPIDADAGANSNLLQTASFVLSDLYVYVNVQSATTGTLNFYSFGK